MKKEILCILLISIALSFCSKHHPDVKLKYGAVASATPEASAVGMDILRKGGNAVDAAIAISFVLGVTEPAMSGIGGGSQVIMLTPEGKKPFSINGSTLSPALTPTSIPKDSLNAYKRSTIPSTVKVMAFLFKNYGSKKLDWATLIQPAINYAKEGFTMGSYREKVYDRYLAKLKKGAPTTLPLLKDSATNKVIQTALANTLEKIAFNGPDAFYQDEMAQLIEDDMIANGGWIRKSDLIHFSGPPIVESIHFKYKGYDIYTQPEPCGGWVVKEILKELESLEKANPDHYLDNLIEAIHHGHQTRIQEAASSQSSNSQGETTHFSVIDANGMAIAITSSINAYYGAKRAHPTLGFLYNSYMEDFNFKDSENKYAVGPNKMAYSSMSPTIVMKDGQLCLVLGSPGSARIISTVAQIIDQYVTKRRPPNKLVNAPRVHAYKGKIYVEQEALLSELSENLKTKYKQRKAPNYSATKDLNAYFGGVHLIVQTPSGFQSFADPRRDGLALFE